MSRLLEPARSWPAMSRLWKLALSWPTKSRLARSQTWRKDPMPSRVRIFLVSRSRVCFWISGWESAWFPPTRSFSNLHALLTLRTCLYPQYSFVNWYSRIREVFQGPPQGSWLPGLLGADRFSTSSRSLVYRQHCPRYGQACRLQQTARLRISNTPWHRSTRIVVIWL